MSPPLPSPRLLSPQVTATRMARQEAASRFLMPALTNTLTCQSSVDRQQGLFSTFEYVTSEYDLEKQADVHRRCATEVGRWAERGGPPLPSPPPLPSF